MTSQSESALTSSTTKRKTPGLTKTGVPRKPHVMTEARKVAFAKCVAARKQQLSSRKKKESVPETTESSSTAVDTSSSTIDLTVESS